VILLKQSFNSNITMKKMTLEERPREKMLINGVKSLSNSELLAIILRTGTKKMNAINLANQIINTDAQGIRNLEHMTIEELCEIEGIGISKAAQIKAALELGVRIASYKPLKHKINDPWDVYKCYVDSLRFLDKEVFKTILLNTKNEVISDVEISVGTLNSSLVHPREVFKEAIKRSTNKIILIHNHPSGYVEPSSEDKSITSRLVKCGEILGIGILDHIIIGDGNYFSFKENMLI
jgi:DNA repair protein RadC